MNTILIIFVLYGQTLVPEFASSFKTQQDCISRSSQYGIYPSQSRKAICIPANPNIEVKKDPEIGVLTVEQIKEFNLKEQIIQLRIPARHSHKKHIPDY
jgi:hypothetical protein